MAAVAAEHIHRRKEEVEALPAIRAVHAGSPALTKSVCGTAQYPRK
jgi:hypothetical protein